MQHTSFLSLCGPGTEKHFWMVSPQSETWQKDLGDQVHFRIKEHEMNEQNPHVIMPVSLLLSYSPVEMIV